MASIPSISGAKADRLQAIPGSVPDIMHLPAGCKFETRCSDRFAPCATVEPVLVERAPGHWVRCHLHDPAHRPVTRG
jgi:oligopeptide/dipeptide ABC transporter ATP-binding protein